MASTRKHRFQQTSNPPMATHKMCLAVIVIALLSPQSTDALTSSFHGISISIAPPPQQSRGRQCPNELVMRKQKASDKHTARLQRGEMLPAGTNALLSPSPPMQILSSGFTKNQWKEKKIELRAAGTAGRAVAAVGGRGRARKRLKVYNSLNLYHETFLSLISEEYRMEVRLSFTLIETEILLFTCVSKWFSTCSLRVIEVTYSSANTRKAQLNCTTVRRSSLLTSFRLSSPQQFLSHLP